jgi:hypothetical protein
MKSRARLKYSVRSSYSTRATCIFPWLRKHVLSKSVRSTGLGTCGSLHTNVTFDPLRVRFERSGYSGHHGSRLQRFCAK